MDKIKSKPGLLNYFKALPVDVRKCFQYIPALVEQFPLDVCLAYVFAEVELGQRLALYCGIVKLHHGHADLAYHAIQRHEMPRAGFNTMYAAIYGKGIPK